MLAIMVSPGAAEDDLGSILKFPAPFRVDDVPNFPIGGICYIVPLEGNHVGMT